MLEELKKTKHLKLLTPTARFTENIGIVRQANNQNRQKHLFHERLVFSFLAFRSRKNLTASLREICRETGLHPNTARAAIGNLTGAVTQQGGKWIAVEPPEGWFRRRTVAHPFEHWSDSYSYTTLFLPRKGAKILHEGKSRKFGLNHAAVFSLILSRSRQSGGIVRNFTFAGLATMLGLNSKTVKTVVDDLVKVGLVHREAVGRSSDLILFPLTDEHLALFQPTPKREKSVSAEQPVQPTPTAYILKGDDYDDYRLVCKPLMPQKYAEEAIRSARRLGIDIDGFEARLARARKCHENNVASGKVTTGNFGVYFTRWLQTEVDRRERQERQEQEIERHQAYQETPEGKAAEAQRRKAIAADPLHREHTVSEQSILARVRFSEAPLMNLREVDKFTAALRRHIKEYLAPKHLPTQKEVDATATLHHRILAAALKKLNHYYQQSVLATGDQFREAIDDVIRQHVEGMKPLGAKAANGKGAETGLEVAHA